jgi:hypothetical protein
MQKNKGGGKPFRSKLDLVQFTCFFEVTEVRGTKAASLVRHYYFDLTQTDANIIIVCCKMFPI